MDLFQKTLFKQRSNRAAGKALRVAISFYKNELSHLPVPVLTKVPELVAGISLRSAGYIKPPVQTKILFVAIFWFSFCDILVTTLPYLPGDGLTFFCFFCCVGL